MSAYQLYEDKTGALFIISAGNPEESDCLTPVTKQRDKAEYILAAVNEYSARKPRMGK